MSQQAVSALTLRNPFTPLTIFNVKNGGYRKRQFFITEKVGARKEAKKLVWKVQTFGLSEEANS
jgi:hypothetical protein